MGHGKALATAMLIMAFCGCTPQLPHEGAWGIYALDLATKRTTLVYSTDEEIHGSALSLSASGDVLSFAKKIGGTADNQLEICTVKTDGTGFLRLTNDAVMDVYPAWSPDGSQLAFLSMPGSTLQMFLMGSDGSDEHLLYDPGVGNHAGDPSWVDHTIAFTQGFAIWTMADDGNGATQVTHPADAGTWGNANLPIGDYDPRLSPDATRIVFERMVDTTPANGSYDLFLVNVNGSGETRLTTNGWAQGLATFSNSGTDIVYMVAAIDGEGKYRLHQIRPDGTDERDITPAYYPPGFLCHAAVFSKDDSKLYFVGQWWQ